MQQPLTAETVRLAYMLFFGRAPEDEGVVQYALSFGTLARLRDAFANSVEFEMLLNRWPRLVPPGAPPLDVPWRATDADAHALLTRLRVAWRDAPPGLPADAGAARDPSGEQQASDLLACLRRAGREPGGALFEFGCGAGRVARHFPAGFASVSGCDLSDARLAAARLACPGTFLPVEDWDFGMPGAFDVWYSHLALQCYPPPLIARVLQRAFALLRPGGAAVFQVPTYAVGYNFDPAAPCRADPSADRHILPQDVIFMLAAEAGCAACEAFDDLSVTPNPLWRSTMFVFCKSGD